MGLFFQKSANKKSSKPVTIFRILLTITMGTLMVVGLTNGFDFFFLKLIFILAGLGSIVNGVEGYFQKEHKKVYLFDFGLAIGWFLMPFIFSF